MCLASSFCVDKEGQVFSERRQPFEVEEMIEKDVIKNDKKVI